MKLIDVDALKANYGMANDCKDCKQDVRSCQYDTIYSKMDFCGWIDDAETVDAVPIVRCKDCKHHHYSECEIPYCDRIDYGYGWKDDDFCSHGERKDGEHHES